MKELIRELELMRDLIRTEWVRKLTRDLIGDFTRELKRLNKRLNN